MINSDRQFGSGSVWTRTQTRSDGPKPLLTLVRAGPILSLCAQGGTVSHLLVGVEAEFGFSAGCSIDCSFSCSLVFGCCCCGCLRISGPSSCVVSACCEASIHPLFILAFFSHSISHVLQWCYSIHSLYDDFGDARPQQLVVLMVCVLLLLSLLHPHHHS
jgi:hypothetical protein